MSELNPSTNPNLPSQAQIEAMQHSVPGISEVSASTLATITNDGEVFLSATDFDSDPTIPDTYGSLATSMVEVPMYGELADRITQVQSESHGNVPLELSIDSSDNRLSGLTPTEARTVAIAGLAPRFGYRNTEWVHTQSTTVLAKSPDGRRSFGKVGKIFAETQDGMPVTVEVASTYVPGTNGPELTGSSVARRPSTKEELREKFNLKTQQEALRRQQNARAAGRNILSGV